jgi:hypothetical protein
VIFLLTTQGHLPTNKFYLYSQEVAAQLCHFPHSILTQNDYENTIEKHFVKITTSYPCG